MEKQLTLKTLQIEAEDLLFSLRYINEDHKAIPLIPEDHIVLKNKLNDFRDHINSYFSNEPLPVSDFEKDLKQSLIDLVISSKKENHKAITRLEIFNSTLQTIFSKNQFVNNEDFINESISTAIHISNESLKALELENE